jgi:hypothetical protein
MSEDHGDEDASPSCGLESPDAATMMDLNNIHAQHVSAVTEQATSAAWHADIAAKQAASLAQWVQYLWGQVATLQHEVKDLEDWKRKALEDMNKLRAAHKSLRKKVMPDADCSEDVAPTKSKSMGNIGESSSQDATKKQPPGLEPPGNVPKSVPLADVSELAQSAINTDEGSLEGVKVETTSTGGKDIVCAQWRIGHLSDKLKNCMGRSLVSSPFAAWGIEDLRLMVFPDGKDTLKGARSKKAKEQYSKLVTEGPLEACLKFKVPDCPPPHVLEYYLKIGEVRKGPFSHNFSESTVNGCSDFGVDWLKQVDSDQSLTVTVEILKP